MMSLLRGVLRKKSMAKEEDVFFDMNINFQRNFILVILYQNCNSMCKEILENCLGRQIGEYQDGFEEKINEFQTSYGQ